MLSFTGITTSSISLEFVSLRQSLMATAPGILSLGMVNEPFVHSNVIILDGSINLGNKPQRLTIYCLRININRQIKIWITNSKARFFYLKGYWK